MKTSKDYRQHAAECRMLARKTLVSEHKHQLLQLAEAWESLAVERERMVVNDGARGSNTLQ